MSEIISVACALLIGGYVGVMIERARILRRMQIAAASIALDDRYAPDTRQIAGAVLDALHGAASK